MERSTVTMDRQRRIYLPSTFKERAGSKFFVLKLGNEIRLVPVPKNPAQDLKELGSKLPRKSIKQFRKDILSEAKKAL